MNVRPEVTTVMLILFAQIRLDLSRAHAGVDLVEMEDIAVKVGML